MLRRTLFALVFAAFAFAHAQDEETPYVPVQLIEETDTHRLIEHPLGPTEVPLSPQRIVALDWQIVDNLLALGAPVVGGVVYGAPYLEPYAGSFTEFAYQPDLEAILVLEPDLILGGLQSGGFAGVEPEQLKRIAPVVALDDHPETYRRDWPLDLGVILGIEEEVSERMAEHQALIDETCAAVRDAIGDETVALLNVRDREFRLYGDLGHTALLYEQGLGLTPPEVVRELTLGKTLEIVSLEIIPRLEDADHLFLMVFDDAQETLSDLESRAIWQNLPAVQAGNVYRVQQGNWLATSLLADEQKLRDIRAALVGE